MTHGRINARPVWAGIAIKLEDGTTYGFELEGSDLEAAIDMTCDEYQDLTEFTYRRMVPGAHLHVDIRVSGWAKRSVRFSDAARDATVHRASEIEPAVRAIEPAP